MTTEPIVTICGATYVGTSTLLHELAGAAGRRVIECGTKSVREAVAANPARFVSRGEPVFIDEFQQVAGLAGAIRDAVAKDARPGRFVLTTPHDVDGFTEHAVRLWPLSQGEIFGRRETFVETLLDDPAGLVTGTPSTTGRWDYLEYIVDGGYPKAVLAETPGARERWLDRCIATLKQEHGSDLFRSRYADEIVPTLRRIASYTGGVPDIEKLVEGQRLTEAMVKRYLDTLIKANVLHRVNAWGSTLTAHSVMRPRTFMADSGLAARLLRMNPDRLASLDPANLAARGFLTRTFCVNEVLKQLSWSEHGVTVGHWHGRPGYQVELVLERDDGGVVGIEATPNLRTPKPDFAGMRTLRAALGDRFLGGVFLNTSGVSRAVGDRLYAVPIDRLWTP